MIKQILIPIVAAAAAVLASVNVPAQEPIPPDEAQKAARAAAEGTDGLVLGVVAVQADADKAQGFKAGEAGILIVPDKRFGAATMSKLGEKPVPVAQIWAHQAAWVLDGKEVPDEKLVLISMDKQAQRKVALYYAAVRKTAGGPVLALYSRGLEPVGETPLRKIEAKQELAVEAGLETAGGSATLSLNLAGGYRAELTGVEHTCDLPAVDSDVAAVAVALSRAAGKLADAPFKVAIDLGRTVAFKEGEAAALVTLDSNLEEKSLAAPGEKTVALGLLSMLRVLPAKPAGPVDRESLNWCEITVRDQNARVPVLVLGAKATAEKGLELLLFSEGKEPLLRVPLEKSESGEAKPVTLTGQKTGNYSGELVLGLFGKYAARIPVALAEQP